MHLIIYGEPKAKQSAKFAKVGKFIKSDQPKEIVNAEATAAGFFFIQIRRTTRFLPSMTVI